MTVNGKALSDDTRSLHDSVPVAGLVFLVKSLSTPTLIAVFAVVHSLTHLSHVIIYHAQLQV